MTQAARHTSPTTDPNELQRAASDPTSSVWVSASAGSGKTTILTKRVLRLLLAGVKPERILCLTFTRAAAAEMSLRVAKELSAWAIMPDNDLSTSIAAMQGTPPTKQQMERARTLFAQSLACPDGMRIRTIHAFGQEILRRFPIEAGLPPHFTVIEENDARQLQQTALMELLATATEPSPVSTLIRRLGEKGFRDSISTLLREGALLGSDAVTLATRARSALMLEPDETDASLIARTLNPPRFNEATMRDAAHKLLHGTSTYKKRGEALLAWLAEDATTRAMQFNNYTKQFLKDDGELYANYGDKKLLASHPDLDDTLRQEAAYLQTIQQRREALNIAETSASAIQTAAALSTIYTRLKRERAALDYDDLVRETLKLFKKPDIAPWILFKLDGGIDHILVDEAQDTSRAQWEIVKTLADEFFTPGSARSGVPRTLFVVGDEKQSIFSFQNADPAAFAELHTFFAAKISEAGQGLNNVPLHVSFRSSPAVLRAVDAVFALPETAQGVSSTPIQHTAFKKYLAGHVEVWPLLAKTKKEETEAWQLPFGYEPSNDPKAAMAQRMANTIKGWIDNNEKLPGESNPIQPRDVMILLRTRGDFADTMVRALKQANLPVTGVDRMHLLEQLPVMDALSLMQFMLLPEDDLNLAALLRGPLLGFGEDDLMKIAIGRGDITLWQSLKNHAADFPAAHTYLAAWLNKADQATPYALLAEMLATPCPGSAVSGRHALWSRLGADALDPLDELLNAAQNFSHANAPSLQHFLHWLSAGDDTVKRELDHGDSTGPGQIRIMTVHGAKGLEAPIVFLPDTTSLPQAQKLPKWLTANDGTVFYISGKPSSGLPLFLWQEARQQQMEEYRRLLYVALTRASHKLVIGGWEATSNEGDSSQSWYRLIQKGLGITADTADIFTLCDTTPPAAHAHPTTNVKTIPSLPAWTRQPAPPETTPAAPLNPSHMGTPDSAASPDTAYARGRVIHRLLQSLPDVEPNNRATAARRFLAEPRHNLATDEQAAIAQEVLRLLGHSVFATFMGPNSRAEVPLVGTIHGQLVSGQVDRLTILPDEVWVLDYKTNRPPPSDPRDTPPAYRDQMESYRALLATLYPQKKVRCFLLWTYTAYLMEI